MDTYAIVTQLFEGESWYSFHDTVYEVTGVSESKSTLRSFFIQLPLHIQHTAFEWGLSDTDFNQEVYQHLKEKVNGTNETTGG